MDLNDMDYLNFDRPTTTTPPPPGVGSGPQRVPQPEVPNIFAEQPQRPQGNGGNQKQQQPQEYEEESQDENYDNGEYYGGEYSRTGVGLKFVGILVLVVMVVIAVFTIKNSKDNKRSELENYLKMNPTGGQYSDGTTGTVTSNNSEVVDIGDMTQLEDSATTEILTDIMKYTKAINAEGRTYLTVESDKYGKYDVFIPNYKYTELEPNGYILVDIEMTGTKPTFLYISSKQDDLKELLN